MPGSLEIVKYKGDGWFHERMLMWPVGRLTPDRDRYVEEFREYEGYRRRFGTGLYPADVRQIVAFSSAKHATEMDKLLAESKGL